MKIQPFVILIMGMAIVASISFHVGKRVADRWHAQHDIVKVISVTDTRGTVFTAITQKQRAKIISTSCSLWVSDTPDEKIEVSITPKTKDSPCSVAELQ